MSISVCMIVKNEEEHLERCLNSVKGIADETIIVDTGSNDRTKDIASKFTDKIFDFKWINDFSAARNFAISKANCNWILSIDADESISFEDAEKIKEVTKNHEANAYHLIWRDYSNELGMIGWKSSQNDKYEESKIASGFTETPVLRLFQNFKGYKFEGSIHETVQNSIKLNNGKIFMTDIALHHYGSLRKKEEVDEKKEKYADMLKERIGEENKEKEDFFIFYEIAREFIMKNDLKKAKEYLEKSFELNPEFSQVLVMLGGICCMDGELDRAEKILKRAVMIDGNNPDVHANLGIVYSGKGEYNKAIKKFERAIELNPRNADYYFNLGLTYLKMGKEKQSVPYFEKSIELNPKYKERVKIG